MFESGSTLIPNSHPLFTVGRTRFTAVGGAGWLAERASKIDRNTVVCVLSNGQLREGGIESQNKQISAVQPQSKIICEFAFCDDKSLRKVRGRCVTFDIVLGRACTSGFIILIISNLITWKPADLHPN